MGFEKSDAQRKGGGVDWRLPVPRGVLMWAGEEVLTRENIVIEGEKKC
jgi:hypothetical protein